MLEHVGTALRRKNIIFTQAFTLNISQKKYEDNKTF